MVKEYELQAVEAERASERLRRIVSNLKSVLQALETGQDCELPSLPLQENTEGQSFFLNHSQRLSTPPSSRPTSQAPQRHPAYANMSMIEAVRQILRDSNVTYSSDDLARQIFEIKSAEDLLHVKRSLSSEISRGLKAGLWKRIGKNLYAGVAHTAHLPTTDLEEIMNETAEN